ncbi:MAG: dihydroorotase, partial [Massilia sp.]|nr:dihydroorotase [Massilia sp.]
TPVDDDEKLLPFGEASPGATGLELLLSLALKWADDYAAGQHGSDSGAVGTLNPGPLSRALAKVTCEAARVAGLAAGQLAPGAAADIVLFDPAARWTVDARALASQGKHTPFAGYEMTGQVMATIVAGRVAYQRKPN